MMRAEYALVRYIADPARYEPRNVGIVFWDGEQWECRIDPEAARRVEAENPHLAPGAVLTFGGVLRHALEQASVCSRDELQSVLSRFKEFPVSISDLRITTLDETIEDSRERRERAIDTLLKRLVRPRRCGGGGPSPELVLERLLRPWILRHQIERDYVIAQSRSGVPRTVHFFINGSRNVAIDALNLNLKRAPDIIKRADAEANKIRDVRDSGVDLRFVVFYIPNTSPDMQDVTRQALQILRAVDAAVTADRGEIERLVSAEP